jgi:hypothetical protein
MFGDVGKKGNKKLPLFNLFSGPQFFKCRSIVIRVEGSGFPLLKQSLSQFNKCYHKLSELYLFLM